MKWNEWNWIFIAWIVYIIMCYNIAKSCLLQIVLKSVLERSIQHIINLSMFWMFSTSSMILKKTLEFVLIIASKYDTITKFLYLYSECNHKTGLLAPELERMERRNVSLITFSMEIFVLLYWYDKDILQFWYQYFH